MINLLSKDFRLLFFNGASAKRRTIDLILKAIVLALFVVIEVYLFRSILLKVTQFDNAARSFLIIFLFVVMILMCLIALVNARKLLFNKQDREELSSFPITNEKIIYSKVLFLVIVQVGINLLVSYPLLATYGAIIHKVPFFYFICIFYPLITSLFEIGIGLILVYPFNKIVSYLNVHLIQQFITSIVILFVFSYLYSRVLSLFMSFVAGGNIASLFTDQSVAKFKSISTGLIPTSFFVFCFVDMNSLFIFPALAISIGFFAIGTNVGSLSYNSYIGTLAGPKSKKKKDFKVEKLSKALIDKELALLFKDSSYIFSYTGLLCVEPFLGYLIINALNTVFTNGLMSYYVSLMKDFMPLMDITILLLLSVTIHSGADNYLGIEGNNIKTMKILPISPLKQLGIKVSIPYVLSLSSSLVTILVLALTKQISYLVGLYSFVIVALFLFLYSLISLDEELKKKRSSEKNTTLTSLFSIVFPILFLVISLVLSFFKANSYLIYGLGILVLVLLLLPYLINLKKRTLNLFLNLEVAN
jgi:hypothetical protein